MQSTHVRRLSFFLLVFLALATSGQAKFLVFGEKVGAGVEVSDFNRALKFSTPSSLWNVSVTAKMVSLTHVQEFDVYLNLQESLYRSERVERVFESRKADLKEFLPNAKFWVETQELQVAGVKALMLRYEDADKNRMYQEVFFVLGKISYQLSFVAKPSTFFKLENDFEFILDSLKTVDGKFKQGFTTKMEEDTAFSPTHSTGF